MPEYKPGFLIFMVLVVLMACSAKEIPEQRKKSTAEDPTIAIITNAFFASGSRFIIVNENHNIDWHRHVSACILDQIAQAGPTILGAEAYYKHEIVTPDLFDPYANFSRNQYFQFIRGTVVRNDIAVFGYDAGSHINDDRARSEIMFSSDELKKRRISPNYPNPRDAKAAENILGLTAKFQNHTIYLHVGFSHVSETWFDWEGGGYGWLAAQIARLTRENPITVYQMWPKSFQWYEDAGHIEWDVEKCNLLENSIPILRTGQGQVGCIARNALRPTQRTDFIIADPIGEDDHVDMAKAALCDVH